MEAVDREVLAASLPECVLSFDGGAMVGGVVWCARGVRRSAWQIVVAVLARPRQKAATSRQGAANW